MNTCTSVWPRTVFELRGDSHFSTPAFMDWAYGKWYVRYLTGLASNPRLMGMVDEQVRRAENDFKKQDTKIVRYFKLDYQAKSWKHEQRVVAKIEITQAGTNVRFVVTSNKNNTARYIYKRYCQRATASCGSRTSSSSGQTRCHATPTAPITSGCFSMGQPT